MIYAIKNHILMYYMLYIITLSRIHAFKKHINQILSLIITYNVIFEPTYYMYDTLK